MKQSILFNKKGLTSLLAGVIMLSAGTTLQVQAFDDGFNDHPRHQQLANHPDGDGPMKRGGNPQEHEARMEARHKKMGEALGLTQEQQGKLKALKEGKKANFKSKMQASHEKRKALHDYMASDDATESGAMAKQRELNALQAEIGEMKVRSFFEMRSILTPEQRQKMKAMHDERKSRMKDGGSNGERRGKRGGERRGQRSGGF